MSHRSRLPSIAEFSPLQRTLVVYGGFILLLIGNYFLIGYAQTEPLALSVVGEQNLVYIDIVFLLIYGCISLLAMVTVSYTVYKTPERPFPADTRVTIVQSVLLLVIAHLFLLYLPLFTGMDGIPVLY